MKTINKIFGIVLIALIAMVGIGAVSASDSSWNEHYNLRAYSDDAGIDYCDVINQSCGGITVDDWVVPSHEPNYDIHVYSNGIGWGPDSDDPEFVGCTFTGNYADGNGGAIYYSNGMTGQLDDGDGNLLSVVPDSSLNPPRPDINIPYYPTDVTEI